MADAGPTSHRVPGRARLRAGSGGGRRRAARSRGVLRSASSAPALVAIPTLAAAGIIALTGTGAGGQVAAVAVSAPQSGTATTATAALTPRAVTGSTPLITEAVLLDRGLPVSRDSERQALGQSAKTAVKSASSGVAKQENAALATLAEQAQEVANRTPQNSWKLPLQSYTLTATFGEGSALWANRHTGLDFAAPTGTILSSVTNGRVLSASYAGAYGNRIVVRTDDGTELYYCHLSAYAVQPGDTVTAGQTIGQVGATGNVTGPHLHLEVRPGGGDPVDPYRALVANGVKP